MKYYVSEHQKGYQQIADSGKSSWDELHGRQDFEDALVRHSLSVALPHCTWQTLTPHALEYGCGTGPGACYLAERGFQVTGIDLDPVAIALARREATARGLAVHYEIGDICAIQDIDIRQYDLVVDSYCLQSIVTDDDRGKLLRFVRNHLGANGYYLICTAGFHTARRYADAHFEPQSGIVYVLADEDAVISDVIEIDHKLYVPYRRHLRVEQLTSELTGFGFRAIWQQVDSDGNLFLLCIV